MSYGPNWTGDVGRPARNVRIKLQTVLGRLVEIRADIAYFWLAHNTRFVNANFTKLAEGILKSSQEQEARFTDSLSQKLPEKSETTSACARVLDLLSLSSEKFHGRRRREGAKEEKSARASERWSKMPLARHGTRARDGAKSTCCGRGRSQGSNISERTDIRRSTLCPADEGIDGGRARRGRPNGGKKFMMEERSDVAVGRCLSTRQKTVVRRHPNFPIEKTESIIKLFASLSHPDMIIILTTRKKTFHGGSGVWSIDMIMHIVKLLFCLYPRRAWICLRISHVKAGRTRTDERAGRSTEG